jgi:hypothetical protein
MVIMVIGIIVTIVMTAVAVVVAEIAEVAVVVVETAEAVVVVETEGQVVAAVAGKRSLERNKRFEITEKIIQDVTTQKIQA